MRPMILAVPALLGLALCACAPTLGSSRANDEFGQLSADCAARGGILVASGQQSGRPQTDNICRIGGGATRIPTGG